MNDGTTHKFRCPCGKVNQFKAPFGDERTVKVRCGACKAICRMTVPADSNEKRINELLKAVSGFSQRMGL